MIMSIKVEIPLLSSLPVMVVRMARLFLLLNDSLEPRNLNGLRVDDCIASSKYRQRELEI
jgi:hypothetical protein